MVDIDETHPCRAQRNVALGGDFRRGFYPVQTVFAGDQHEMAAVHQRSQGDAPALAFNPCVRQRVSGSSAWLVNPNRVNSCRLWGGVIDNRRRTVGVSEIDAVLAEFVTMRCDGLAELMTP